MNKKAFYGLLLGLGVPLVAFFIMKALPSATSFPRRVYYDSVTLVVKRGKRVADTAWSTIPDFTLTNQLGQSVSMHNLKGKVVVADFFFTHCPTICPAMTANMKLLQEAVKRSEKVGDRSADFVQFLSFSIDPERDSVQRLKAWADRFQINPVNWWLLTGNKKTIYDLSLNKMKLIAEDGHGIDTAFIHTDKIVLIDREGVIRMPVNDSTGNLESYHGLDTSSLKRLAEDIVLLSIEKPRKKEFFLAGQLWVIAGAFGSAILGIILLFVFLKKEKKTNEYKPDQR